MKKTLLNAGRGFAALLPLLVLSFCVSPAMSRADVAPTVDGFHDQSEVGIVTTTGNSDSQTFNLAQTNTYTWDGNLVKFNGKYLDTSANSVNTALYFIAGLRYERQLSDRFNVFAGQNIEGDVFSGYRQRYNTDVGGKYFIYREEAFTWSGEAGYRYTVENRFDSQVTESFIRLYTEAVRNFTTTFSAKLDLEYLQNVSQGADYRLNPEIAVAAAINSIFAIKTGYVVKYRNVPPPGILKSTDTQFTTALVAKF